MKKCPYCKICFTPHVKVGSRQKTCGKPECKKALKAETNRRWREKNPDHYQNDYPRLRQWLDDHPGYLKDYRESHPGYVQKNREAQRVRDRKKRLLLDIQAQLKSQVPEVTDQLCHLSNLDIQAQLSIKPLEMTFLFGALPCLDIQVQLDRPFCVLENGAIHREVTTMYRKNILNLERIRKIEGSFSWTDS